VVARARTALAASRLKRMDMMLPPEVMTGGCAGGGSLCLRHDRGKLVPV
jgi:hypothetical protein